MRKSIVGIALLTLLVGTAIGTGWGCGGGGGSSSPKETSSQLTEPKELIETTEKIEEAFTNADAQALETYIDPDTLELYESAIAENPEKLAGFAEIFKTRRLLWTDGLQAVYEVTYEGQKFELTMTRDADGIWKLEEF